MPRLHYASARILPRCNGVQCGTRALAGHFLPARATATNQGLPEEVRKTTKTAAPDAFPNVDEASSLVPGTDARPAQQGWLSSLHIKDSSRNTRLAPGVKMTRQDASSTLRIRPHSPSLQWGAMRNPRPRRSSLFPRRFVLFDMTTRIGTSSAPMAHNIPAQAGGLGTHTATHSPG